MAFPETVSFVFWVLTNTVWVIGVLIYILKLQQQKIDKLSGKGN